MRIDVDFQFTDGSDLEGVVRGSEVLSPLLVLKEDLAGYATKTILLDEARALHLLFTHSGLTFCRVQVKDAADATLIEIDVTKDDSASIPLPATARELLIGNGDATPAPIQVSLL